MAVKIHGLPMRVSVFKLAEVIKKQSQTNFEAWQALDTLVRELDAELKAKGSFIRLAGFEQN